MKIIGFPFAGGSKFSFQKVSKNNSNFITLEYPGRGMRINEKLSNSINELIEDLLQAVVKIAKSEKEYIIYGHSMGALVGFLMCHRLKKEGVNLPNKLIVSGNKGPMSEKISKLSFLPENEFWDEVVRLGGTPNELNGSPEIRAFFTPILKADFSIIENYEPKLKEKLNIPIDVFYGKDEGINDDEILYWKELSSEPVNIKRMEGDHFFIFKHQQFFENYFEELTNKLMV
jgi:external thioesterase TEII